MLRVLCSVLIVSGLCLFGLRAGVLDFPLLPDADSPIWSFEIQADLEGSGEGARVEVQVPPASGLYVPLDERFLSERLSLTVREDSDGDRRAIWTTRDLGTATSVYYRANFFSRPIEDENAPHRLGPADLPQDYTYVAKRQLEQITLASRMYEEVAPQSFDDDTLTSLLLNRFNNRDDDLARQLLQARSGTVPVAEAIAYVLFQQGTFARPVYGVPLRDTREAITPSAWLELWTGETWRAYDVETGQPFTPRERLVLWRGEGGIATTEGTVLRDVRVALSRLNIGSVDVLAQRQGATEDPFVMATLLQLPLNTQIVLQTLLVIPVGVLVLVFMRQFIGVPTFGTFMPVLIALAFASTSLLTGLGILFTVLLVGMTFRLFFSRLNLLLVPRLAAMLTVIILAMIGLSVLADQFSLGTGFSVTLFPIVILTMTVERLSVTWEENGPLDASKEFAGSILVAITSYAAMSLDTVRHLVFIFPELMLVILAILLMMGRYSGFRLSELRRFRELQQRS